MPRPQPTVSLLGDHGRPPQATHDPGHELHQALQSFVDGAGLLEGILEERFAATGMRRATGHDACILLHKGLHFGCPNYLAVRMETIMTPPSLAAADVRTYAGTWTLDPVRTTVTFLTKAMWVIPVKGTARTLEGRGEVRDDGTVDGRLVIDAASIATGMSKRDTHLRGEDFFDAERHRTIEFDLTSARPLGGDRFTLEGTLLVSGHRRAVTVEATVSSDGATTTVAGTIDDLDRRQWGLEWAKMGAGVHNRIAVTAVFTRS